MAIAVCVHFPKGQFIDFNNNEAKRYWEMEEKQKKILNILMAAVLLASMYLAAQQGAVCVNSGSVATENADKENQGNQKYCVVIDAGHGGADPGKVGINGALEKDINLQIAEKLKTFLGASDVKVVMTRTDDGGLYDENASNKKVQDMKRRIAIIEEAQPELVVSIHQNSYHEEYVNGAQVFYYNGSESSKRLAELLQKRFVINVDPENKREAKGNDSYYLLKKTSRPIVIVECGFLSNAAEAEKLATPIYQEKAAWAIHMGIMQYLNTDKK